MIRGVAGVWLTHLTWWSLKLSAKSWSLWCPAEISMAILQCDTIQGFYRAQRSWMTGSCRLVPMRQYWRQNVWVIITARWHTRIRQWWCQSEYNYGTDNSSLSYSLYSWLSVCYSSEHQELAKQIQEQTDPAHPQATSGLERQLELLVEHLETKAEQIKIVRKQLLTRRQRSRSRSRLHQATASLPVARDGEVEVTTTVKAKGSPQNQAYSTVDCKTPSLEFLKKMKSLQNTLQRDDLSWDWWVKPSI